MPQKKKILHIIQSLDNGGCENMLLRTLPLLDDFEHKIITLKEPGELAQRFISADIVIETVYCNGFFDILGILRLRRLTQKEAPDLIITYLFHADILGRLILKTCAPVVPFLRTTYNHPKYLIARFLEWLTKPLVKRYIANSEAVKDFYVKRLGVTPEKITVIPNGIDTDFFDGIISDPNLRKSLGITQDDFVITCVANLHPNKGHRYLLEAFENIYREYPATHLLIVGDGIERDNLKNQIRTYASKNNISFLGRRIDVPQLLKISDCFVLPTLFEGMSNAIMEAMASSLPVITTDIPENRALIKNDISSLLIPPRSSKNITDAVIALINDSELYRMSSEYGHVFIKKNFSLESSINSFRKFLNAL